MSRDTIISILKGAGIAAAGAVLTWGTAYVGLHSFGEWTPAVVAGWAVVVNAGRKWLTQEEAKLPAS